MKIWRPPLHICIKWSFRFLLIFFGSFFFLIYENIESIFCEHFLPSSYPNHFPELVFFSLIFYICYEFVKTKDLTYFVLNRVPYGNYVTVFFEIFFFLEHHLAIIFVFSVSLFLLKWNISLLERMWHPKWAKKLESIKTAQ